MELIIYAHPDPKSFNYAVLQSVKKSIEERKAVAEIIDLYAIGYNPVLTLEELKGAPTEETLALQKKVKAAEKIIFIFPVWWFRAPAILEGFCDKVFTPGFAYRFKRIIGNYGIPIPLLKEKKVVAFISHGAPALPVKTIYVNAVKFRFLLGFLSFCFNIFKCRIYQFWAVPFVSDEKRRKYLKKAERIVSKL